MELKIPNWADGEDHQVDFRYVTPGCIKGIRLLNLDEE
jgi:hypothetical protein